MIAFGIMQFISFRSAGQMTMTDYVCTGQTRQYYVIPGRAAGSTYTWWLDGNVMSGYNTNEFVYTWTSSETYLIEVQERSADGCPGPKISGLVFVNPQPEIQINVSDTMICDGESMTISVQNTTDLIWGKWIYDLIAEPDAGITGNTISGTYASPANFSETLINNDKALHKVVYRFIPRIVTDDGAQSCEGKEVKFTVWINPGFRCREAYLEIPNAFSPNGDGINDVWNIIGKDSYPEIEVTVYNRWGQAVWKSVRGYPVPWDGRSRGKVMPVDSYHYLIELHDGTRAIIGNVTVVR
ncbi:MAG: gliding motility-associated C-terminal domain-containing protein [Bacteroidales bacterium]